MYARSAAVIALLSTCLTGCVIGGGDSDGDRDVDGRGGALEAIAEGEAKGDRAAFLVLGRGLALADARRRGDKEPAGNVARGARERVAEVRVRNAHLRRARDALLRALPAGRAEPLRRAARELDAYARASDPGVDRVGSAAASSCDHSRRARAHRADGGTPSRSAPVAIPCLTRTGFDSFEPTIGHAADGSIFFYPAFATRAGSGGSFPEDPQHDQRLRGGVGLAVSRDGGSNWSFVQVRRLAGDPTPVAGDPFLYVDSTTSRLFVTTSLIPTCGNVARSADSGRTFSNVLMGCLRLSDNQKVFAGPPTVSRPSGYPNVVYYCAVAEGTLRASNARGCLKSLDGGRTFIATGSPPYRDGPGRNCNGFGGSSEVGPDGTVYVPRGWCDEPYLAVSRDEGRTWKRIRVPGPRHVAGTVGADVAVGNGGTLFYAWIADDRLPRLAISRDRGESWDHTLRVAAPGVREANLIAVDATRDGDRVALSYLGSTDAKGPPFPEGKASGTRFNGYISLSLNPHSRQPTFLSAAVNTPRDPLVLGTCVPDFCPTSHYDFIDLRFDKRGEPWATFVDACTATCSDDAKENAREGVIGRFELRARRVRPRLRLTVVPRRVRAGTRRRFRFRVTRRTRTADGRIKRRGVRRAQIRFAGRRLRTNRRGRARVTLRLRRTGRRVARARKRGFRPGKTRVRVIRR